jgi:8-oxo-dGTP diphosphatase
MSKIPHYPVAVDCVLFGAADTSLEVLLIRRGVAPFADAWALPGGLVLPEETLEQAVLRELQEETAVRPDFLEQLYTFGAPGRDPRGRVVSVAYLGLVRPERYPPAGATDAAEARWWPVSQLPPLAFDHAQIIDVGRTRLQGKVRYQPLGFELLPERFTLTQLQSLYEVVLERELDKRNFRRKVLKTGLLIDTGEKVQNVRYRPPKLYRFDEPRYRELEQQGYLFEL